MPCSAPAPRSTGADDRWSVSLFGNNLTNTQYSLGHLYQVLDGPLGLRNGVFPGSTAVRSCMPTRGPTARRRRSASNYLMIPIDWGQAG